MCGRALGAESWWQEAAATLVGTNTCDLGENVVKGFALPVAIFTVARVALCVACTAACTGSSPGRTRLCTPLKARISDCVARDLTSHLGIGWSGVSSAASIRNELAFPVGLNDSCKH